MILAAAPPSFTIHLLFPAPNDSLVLVSLPLIDFKFTSISKKMPCIICGWISWFWAALVCGWSGVTIHLILTWLPGSSSSGAWISSSCKHDQVFYWWPVQSPLLAVWSVAGVVNVVDVMVSAFRLLFHYIISLLVRSLVSFIDPQLQLVINFSWHPILPWYWPVSYTFWSSQWW